MVAPENGRGQGKQQRREESPRRLFFALFLSFTDIYLEIDFVHGHDCSLTYRDVRTAAKKAQEMSTSLGPLVSCFFNLSMFFFTDYIKLQQV
jgi:hypothetical protein